MEAVGKFEVFRLLHRVIVFAIALWYVVISVKTFVAPITVLRGFESNDLGTTIHESKLIVAYAGDATINESPLAQRVLKGSTALRGDSTFLLTDNEISFTECTNVPGYDESSHATRDLEYLAEVELIAPVIDCSLDLIVATDEAVTQLRMYFLMLGRQYQSGAALLVILAPIKDMQATEVTHQFAIAFNYPYESEPHFTSAEFLGIESDNFWLFKSFPQIHSVDPAREVRTAYRMGGYIDDPWHAFASLHDSWAWTHSIHGIFAIDVLGIFWVGDAFATISNALLYRGVLLCLAIGSELTGRRSVHYRPELAHADLLTFFLNVTSVLSYFFHERIDPVLAFAAFELGFSYRVALVDALPALRKVVVDFAEEDYWLGVINVSPFLAKLSPMKFWTIHEITVDRKTVVISTVICIFSPMIYFDTGEEQLTSFETATGAALSKRYGRYASIDAVYGNGYLIANHKYLVATEDIFSVLAMKLTRVRFTNIYVYTILPNGGVNQTAQLVYPRTIPWSDLAHLGVVKLA
ncbi:uncharacterized protein PITG_01089 [Phytophthora infestans T30-4]|uniref:Transmembrane protein n=1 Tax=Phytophthora infestans (strain T30-4) TaxID=403677 RepID=D0MSF5_PHYIT|nr:uncharacterized protein PITG_01089 [Phytophthora infestans T30-4]EEY58424.1 conserved hypothetical protein [Phytophthora infestans T30-4]|eukprot:XP_002909610.1 conserved hypothetical protein [Phytophthora infestans T30-4]